MYILIVNEQPLGRSLAAVLVKHGHEVAYVDRSSEYCQRVTAELGCLVIQGADTDLHVLQEAGIERADVVVALLETDIKNIMVGLFAKQHGVPRILANLRQEHYRATYDLAGIGNTFSAYDYLLNELLMSIEEPNVRKVMVLGDGRIEIAAISVPANPSFLGRGLTTLWEHRDYPQGALVLGLLKFQEQSFHLPREQPIISSEDEILVLGSPEYIHQISVILSGGSRGFLAGARSRLP
jgi:trk system potassium uptake protein TrkA